MATIYAPPAITRHLRGLGPAKAVTGELTAWAPMIGLASLVLLAELFIVNVGYCGGDRTPSCIPHQPPAFAEWPAGFVPFGELQARLTWCLAALFYLMSVFGLVLVASGMITGSTRESDRADRFITGLWIVAGIALAPALGGHDLLFNAELLGRTVYKRANIGVTVDVIEFLAVVALAALGVASSRLLVQANNKVVAPSIPPAVAAVWLARLQRRAQTLLNVGAIALVAGTLQVKTLYAWAATMIAPATKGAPAESYYAGSDSMSGAMGMLSGALYSLLLAAIFVPCFAQLQRHANQLADREASVTDAPTRAAWLASHGLDATIVRKALGTLAMLAPLIGGSLASVLSSMN